MLSRATTPQLFSLIQRRSTPHLNELRIRRTWNQLPQNGRDTLEMFFNGEFPTDLTTGWDERIEAILSPRISKLVLFDGEQVKDLAKKLTVPPSVISAIRKLFEGTWGNR